MPGLREITHKCQPTNLVFVLPPKEDLRALLGLFTVNHVYTTETLGKEGKNKKYYVKGY